MVFGSDQLQERQQTHTTSNMAFIDVIQHEQAEGQLKEIYDHLVETRGKLAEVHKIQSLNPQSIVHHMELYLHIMFGQSPLKRVRREMIAVVVSRGNNCAYCQIHHAEAVNHYWKDEARTEELRKDYKNVGLDGADLALCDLAWRLTRDPGAQADPDHLKPLREAGLSDREILDATLVIAYFNFVNRLVLGLGVQVEEGDGAGGYNYD